MLQEKFLQEKRIKRVYTPILKSELALKYFKLSPGALRNIMHKTSLYQKLISQFHYDKKQKYLSPAQANMLLEHYEILQEE